LEAIDAVCRVIANGGRSAGREHHGHFHAPKNAISGFLALDAFYVEILRELSRRGI
jgi:hypothetical protein